MGGATGVGVVESTAGARVPSLSLE